MATDPVMYIIINKGAGMTAGKAIAQGAHASVEAFRLSDPDSNLMCLWYKGNGYKKIVLEGRNEIHMHTIMEYIRQRGIGCVPIIDEGYTEVEPHTFTAIGVELVDKNDPHVQATFSDFNLFKGNTLAADQVKPKRFRRVFR